MGLESSNVIQKISNQIVLIALCFGFFMVIVDVTIVNIALPSIAKNLSGGISGLQWIVDGYTLTFAGLLLSAGHLSDRLGAKKVFLMGLLLFVFSSLGCGAAFNFNQLIIFRVLQGIGAALLVPTSLALINESYEHEQVRSKAIGVWAAMGGIAAVIGPLLGAVLTYWGGWRTIFFVNVPIGILAFLLTAKYVPSRDRTQKNKHLDFWGQLLAIISIGALAFGLIEAGKVGWFSQNVAIGLTSFLCVFVVFLWVEYRCKNPMFPLNFFNSKTFSTTIIVGMILNFCVYGELFVFSLYFQQVRHYSILLSGLAFMPLLGVVALTSYLGGKITSQRGPKLPMVVGLAVGSLGFFLMLISKEQTPHYFMLVPPLMAIGFGIAFTIPAATEVIIRTVPKERVGVASGMLNASRQTGSLMGVAIFGSIINTVSDFVFGLHITLIIAGMLYLTGCLLTMLFINK